MNNPSRRHFLEGAAATIAGAAVLSSGTAEAAAKKGSKGTASYDLIIVGAGCGGLVCAVRAAQIGLKPLLLEKMMDSSGNTIYAAGFMLGTNTKMQRAAGISGDTTDKFYDDMIKVSKGHGDPALTRYFVDHADQTLEWRTIAVSNSRLVCISFSQCLPGLISFRGRPSLVVPSWRSIFRRRRRALA